MREHQIRQCIVCRQRAHKEDLARIAFCDGVLIVDEKFEKPGRGVYVHRNAECLLGKFDEARIGRALRTGGVNKSDVRRVFNEIKYVKD